MGLQPLRRVLKARAVEVADGVARRASGEIVRTHTPTGLAEFDDVFGGLELGVLTLIIVLALAFILMGVIGRRKDGDS